MEHKLPYSSAKKLSWFSKPKKFKLGLKNAQNYNPLWTETERFIKLIKK
jgi:hypothetical protein